MTLDPEDLERVVRSALEEDLRYGPDITTAAVISPGAVAVADVVARQPGVLAGLPIAAAVLDAATRPIVTFTPLADDGSRVSTGDVVARVEGPLAEILTAERTMLNFLTHLSGIATATRAWVDAVAGTGAVIRDTRKTIPGLRSLEKYAVRCGGGVNHRMGLGDAALIKDNHVAAAGGIAAAFKAVRAAAPSVVVEVECDTLDQVAEALAIGATLILLDNMSLDEMSVAVKMATAYPAAKLEASGGLRLPDARAVAETGVHYLAVGALTHSSPALDLALDVAPGRDASPGPVVRPDLPADYALFVPQIALRAEKPPVTDSSSASGAAAPKIDTSIPHSARVWNYWLGGKDFYPVDREIGDQVIAMVPDIVRIARLQRAFLVSAVRYLVREAGIRQFLDIGTGLPAANNTHEVAQAIAPESRIVYVDNDPLVLVHARALLTSTPAGACDYIDADVRDPGKILSGAAATLDFNKPVAIMLLGILGQIPDSDSPQSIIRRLLDAVPSGSYLALGDGANTNPAVNEAIGRYNETSRNAYHLRTPEQITGFLDGLELVEPGVVGYSQWRPEATPFPDAGDVPALCGVARKP